MKEVYLNMPQLAPGDFLPIFTSATLVMIFGIVFVGLYTFAKMEKIPAYFQYVGYLAWFGCAYSLYLLSTLVGSGDFTRKVLMLTMVAYLILPHFIYFLMQETHEQHD